jgi:hypothetical protein
VVRVLAGLLRVAAALERTRSGVVTGVRVKGGHHGKPLRLLVETTPGADAELELYSARSRQELMAQTLGVSVEIEAVPSPQERAS